MATKSVKLSTTSLGTLVGVTASAGLAIADVAAISALIADDQKIVSSTALGASGTSLFGGVVLNGITTTTLSTITNVSIAQPSTATIAALTAGTPIFGFGIAPNTFVLSATGTTITMNQAPTSGQNTGYFTAVRNFMGTPFDGRFLVIPNRGVLKVLPGDVAAVDQSGWPILLSKNAINFLGTPWSVT